VDDAGVERAIAALAAWRREVGGPHGEPQR
jgi:hypothetical protein